MAPLTPISHARRLCRPRVGVLQELFGVNADICKTCDELAEQGFVAVAPDLFWRQEPGVDLSVTSETDWQHGLRLYQAYDRDAGVRNIKDTLDAVAKLPDCTGKIAVQGYCLGAMMTFTTCRALPRRRRRRLSWRRHLVFERGRQSSCAPAYASGRGGRVHFQASASSRLSSTGVANQTRRSTAIRGSAMPFARHNGAHYNAAAAALANGRTSEFLCQQLR